MTRHQLHEPVPRRRGVRRGRLAGGGQTADANNPHPGFVVVVHGGGPHPPAAQIAKTCSGPSVTVWVRDGGRREKRMQVRAGRSSAS